MQEETLAPVVDNFRRTQTRFIVDGNASIMAAVDPLRPLLLYDLSARGVGLLSRAAFFPGEEMRLVISAPLFYAQAQVRLGRVCWCRRLQDRWWQAGVDFGHALEVE